MRAYRLTHPRKIQPLTPEKRAKRQAYEQANRDKIAARKKAHRHAHPEQHLQYYRAYAKAHQEKLQTYRRVHRQANQQRLKAYRKEYRKKNHTRIKIYNAQYAKIHPEIDITKSRRRRAQKYGASLNDFTHGQWVAMQEHYDHRCVYCGKRRKGKLTQDHITPLSKGGNHTLSNIVPACRSCNSTKNAGPPLSPIQPLLL